jgi:hypothetical protein
MEQWEGAQNKPRRAGEFNQMLLEYNDYGNENPFLNCAGAVPEDAYRFAVDQMVANGFAVHEGLSEVIATGVAATLHFVGLVDPYVMYLFGLSDVSFTDDWANCTFEINPYNVWKHDVPEDVYWDDPEEYRQETCSDEIESYTYTPEQGQQAYYQLLASPGLGNLPAGIGTHIRDVLHGGLGFEDRYAQITSIAHEALKEACCWTDQHGATRFDTIRMDLYFECAAWAAFVWIMSPLSLRLRCANLYLTSAVFEHGEAILVYPGWVYGSNRYSKRENPPEMCYVRGCGVSAYCVTMTLVGDDFAHICEHCKSYGEDLFPPANCGSRVCKAVSCMHHPYNGMGKQLGTHEMLRKSGLLLNQGDPLRGLLGSPASEPLRLR